MTPYECLTFTRNDHHIKSMRPFRSNLTSRILAAGVHLGISLAIAGAAAALVFGVWYPAPYQIIAGGTSLFLLVISVDVVMGPLLTLAVFNRTKPVGELKRDLLIIAVLQSAALGYGLWTVAAARPVHLVFELDRFRVVHAIDIPVDKLVRAAPGLRRLPLWGPTLLSIRKFSSPAESFDMTMNALQGGVALSAQPELWQAYADARDQVIARAQPLSALVMRFPDRRREINAAMAKSTAERPKGLTGSRDALPEESVGYLPLVGRQAFWTVLIDMRTADIVGFVPIDSF